MPIQIDSQNTLFLMASASTLRMFSCKFEHLFFSLDLTDALEVACAFTIRVHVEEEDRIVRVSKIQSKMKLFCNISTIL